MGRRLAGNFLYLQLIISNIAALVAHAVM